MKQKHHTSGNQISYFGYGSLVNLATLRTSWLDAQPVRVKGWKRCWLVRPNDADPAIGVDNLAFLSVRADKETFIDGMMVSDHRKSLIALDEREALYERTPLVSATIEILRSETPIASDPFLYVASGFPKAGSNAKILRSYLDAVFQGYLEHFGEEGLSRFLATTENFDCQIVEDREEPFYPRPVVLSTKEKHLFDELVPEQY